jgi:hypothetical protein
VSLHDRTSLGVKKKRASPEFLGLRPSAPYNAAEAATTLSLSSLNHKDHNTHIAMMCVCGTGNQSQGLVDARQALYH